MQPKGRGLTMEMGFPRVERAGNRAALGRKGGTEVRTTRTPRSSSGSRGTNTPPTARPFSTASWAAASEARKKTTLPYILEAATMAVGPTTLANART